MIPQKPLKALAYGILIWVIGFVWGSIVFMTPVLKNVAPIPYISRNPAISFPILLIWLVLTYLLARNYLRSVTNPAGEGLLLGMVFFEINIALDLVVLVFLLNAGVSYFVSAPFGWLILFCY
jgi:hypothetical protein